MASFASLVVYSNDGQNLVSSTSTGYSTTWTVTDWGVQRVYSSKYYGERLVNFKKKLVGLATSANATTPTYSVGSTFTVSVGSTTTLYVVEADKESIPAATYDLSQLNLPKGTHTITAVAKADGYGNSVRSNAVEYVVKGITVETLSTTTPGSGIYADALTIGTKIWLFDSSAAHVFDPDTYTLTTNSATLSPVYTKRALTAIGTKVYLFGGHGTVMTGYSASFNTISVFDTETSTMQTLSATLPNKAESIASAAVGKKIYLFGGYHARRTNDYTDSSYEIRTISVFDTETNTRTTLSESLPTAAMDIAATAVGTKIYLFGGLAPDLTYLDTINVFDTETNTIKTLDVTLPTPARYIGSVAIGTKIYLFGGLKDYLDHCLNTINVFDTETNTIKTLDETLPVAAYGFVSTTVGTNAYLFGGSTGAYGGLNTIIEVQT